MRQVSFKFSNSTKRSQSFWESEDSRVLGVVESSPNPAKAAAAPYLQVTPSSKAERVFPVAAHAHNTYIHMYVAGPTDQHRQTTQHLTKHRQHGWPHPGTFSE